MNFIRALGWSFCFRFYSWVDLIMMINHMFVFIKEFQFLYRYVDETEKTFYNNYEYDVKMIRTLFVIGILTQFTRFTYFLSLIDQIAYLVDIMKQVLIDIIGFMVILLLIVFAFSLCFYTLS